MTSKKEIIAKHKKNLNIIKKHNKNYFIHDSPKISDAEYDELKTKALKFEKNYSFLKKFESISNIVGSKPLNNFKKTKHLTPMLSLSNAFNLSDMENFLKKINNFINKKKK